MRKGTMVVLAVLALLAGDWYVRTQLTTSTPPATATPSALPTPAARARETAANIERKTAALLGAPRTIELPSDQALATLKALREQRFADASKIATAVVTASALSPWRYYPFNNYITAVGAFGDADFEKRLDAWVAFDEQAALPYLIRARYRRDMGWRLRGTGFSQETGEHSMQAFSEYQRQALEDVRAAIKRDPANPYAYFMELRVLFANGNTPAMAQAFSAAIARYPDYYLLYRTRLRSLVPKWGGSLPEMFAFVDKYAGEAAADSPRRMLYLELYAALLDTVSVGCRKLEGDALEACMSKGLSLITPPGLDAHIAATLKLYERFDKQAYTLELEGILTTMVDTRGAGKQAGAVLQLAADAMGSETQLMEERPGKNNYMLDAITAHVWLRDEHYANAETKYQEALRDLDHAPITNEAERLTARAALLSALAEVHTEKHEFDQAIVYQRAAEALGIVDSAKPWIICNGYFRLEDYPTAIAECTRAFDSSGDYLALFFRGKSQLALKHREEAIKDLSMVADSEHWKRTDAAIELSVVYGAMNDIEGELKLFNNHAYLFDERTQSKEDLAIAYNNRCYGYKQLGQLEKALADCTASLKFGNLPDAFHKQQELLKALKAHTKGA